MNTPLLKVEGLTKIFGRSCPKCLESTGPSRGNNRCPHCGSIVAVAGVDLDVCPGEVVGIVGESGSGKSTLLSMLHLDVQPTIGRAYFRPYKDGQVDVFSCNPAERRRLQNFHLGMLYQKPEQGLRLHVTAGGNVAERLLLAGWRNVHKMRERSGELLQRTEVPIDRLDDFPLFFSGGMQQRVQIAKVLANGPALLLMDEMTTGLDLSVQAGVLDLVRLIQLQLNLAMIVVSHDLGVVRLLAERVVVMKQGRVVERGLTDQILEDPQDGYTQLLVSCMM